MSLSALQELNAIPRSAIGTRVRIAYTNGYTYLRAYCNLRDQERTFRLDRIRSWEQNGWEQRGAGDEEKRGDKQTHAVPQSPLIPFPQPPRSIPQAVVSGGTAPPARRVPCPGRRGLREIGSCDLRPAALLGLGGVRSRLLPDRATTYRSTTRWWAEAPERKGGAGSSGNFIPRRGSTEG